MERIVISENGYASAQCLGQACIGLFGKMRRMGRQGQGCMAVIHHLSLARAELPRVADEFLIRSRFISSPILGATKLRRVALVPSNTRALSFSKMNSFTMKLSGQAGTAREAR